MMKPWSLIAMAGALLGAVSCAPVGGTYAGANGGTGVGPGLVTANGNSIPTGSAGSGQRASAGDLRELREQRQAQGNERLINSGDSASGAGWSGGDGSGALNSGEDMNLPPLPPINIDYRYAMPVPGRPGWVYNPYTNRPVDVRGVESGRLIYDERDPENRNEDGTLKSVSDMPNKFRVP